jgi:hypothetical protein
MTSCGARDVTSDSRTFFHLVLITFAVTAAAVFRQTASAAAVVVYENDDAGKGGVTELNAAELVPTRHQKNGFEKWGKDAEEDEWWKKNDADYDGDKTGGHVRPLPSSPLPHSRPRGRTADRQQPGSFCSTVGCCSDRDDSCSASHDDTTCYCDSFCNRTASPDCCPDHWIYCLGAANGGVGDEASTDTDDVPPAPLQLISSPDITNECSHDGENYKIGDEVKIICNNCTCDVDDEDLTLYRWQCTKRNCAMKPELLERIEIERPGWQAYSYPEFQGHTVDELARQKLGTRLPDRDVVDMTSIKIPADGSLPDEFDARNQWPGWIGRPMDQGKCGASWAFSTASVGADRLAIQSRGTVIVKLSAQQLISCIFHHNGESGCHPNGFDRAWWFIRKIGIVSDECYPYDSGSSSHPGVCLLPRSYLQLVDSKCPSAVKPLTVYKASPPYKILPKETEIMKEIKQNGPVQALMEAREDFYTYKSGVYQSTLADDELTSENERKRIHSVKIVGWGTDHSTGKPIKYWLCANSWGEKWGEDGYFRIVRGRNESSIESLVVGVWMNSAGDNGKSQTFARQQHNKHPPNNNGQNGYRNGYKPKET